MKQGRRSQTPVLDQGFGVIINDLKMLFSLRKRPQKIQNNILRMFYRSAINFKWPFLTKIKKNEKGKIMTS